MSEIGEWLMACCRIPIAEYEQLTKRFNPVGFDADAWVRCARDAGMKYLIFTAKHHDGFAMYHSRVDRYNIVDATPFKRDPLGELAEACRKYGVRFCFYYSQALDWHDPDAGGTAPDAGLNLGMSWGNDWDFPDHRKKDFRRYLDRKVKPQLHELLTQYGPVGSIWFDCPFGINRAQCEELYAFVRQHQPDCIMNSRLGNGLGDLDSQGDNCIPDDTITHDWESPMTLNDTWGFKSGDTNWKDSATLLRTLCDIASKGGNYLLNVGPTAEGKIPDPSLQRLAEVGRWMQTNSAAIYGAKASPLGVFPWGRCTQKGDTLYLHIFRWPQDGRLEIPARQPVTEASLLAAPGQTVGLTRTADTITLTLPARPAESPVYIVALSGH
jgi:alpha-L-fucosidase